MNDGWKFIKQNVSGTPYSVSFNDASWSNVSVPHTWNASDGTDGGFYHRGIGWYRKTFTLPAEYSGKQLYIEFNAVSLRADVYVNGELVGIHKGGYTAFRFDITEYVNLGRTNVIAVKVNNSNDQREIAPLEGDFTVYGGIYRDVNLIVTEGVHVDLLDNGAGGMKLTTTDVSHEQATLTVGATIVNDTSATKTVTVKALLKHPDEFVGIDEIPEPRFNAEDMYGGGDVAEVEKTVTIAAGEQYDFSEVINVSDPHLWDGIEDPYRYQVDMTLTVGGLVVDSITDYVGFRYFEVDPDNGFMLNGRSYPLRGVAMHQDWEGLGNAISKNEHNINMALIYEIGANTVRAAHYPHDDYVYELFDKYGIVVWAEIPLVGTIGGSGDYSSPDATRQEFFDVTKQQLTELIMQNYNHPSIAFWGLQNEVREGYSNAALGLMEELDNLANTLDPSRLTTQATNHTTAFKWESDLMALNIYAGWYTATYDDFGKLLDERREILNSGSAVERPFGVSEYGAGASLHQHEDDPEQPAARGQWHPEEYQNLTHEAHIEQIEDRDYIWGSYVWNMFDFGSDSRDEGGQKGINNKGLVTFDRTVKKDSFYLYKSYWNPEPMVHVTSRRFDPRTTPTVEIKAYSNCDSAELFVNGVSMGTLSQNELAQANVYVWEDIALSPEENTVKVVGTKDGEAFEDEIVWTRELSNDTELSSDTLRVDNTAKQIILSKAVTFETLFSNISNANRATITVFENDGTTPVTQGAILPGMKLVVAAEDGKTVATYTFVQSNIAYGKTATSSTVQDNDDGYFPASNVTDGDQNTRWTASTSYTGTYPVSYPENITVDLGDIYTLDSIDIYWFKSGTNARRYAYEVYVSTDGANFEKVVDRPNASSNPVGLISDKLNAISGRYVKIEVLGNNDFPNNKYAAASIMEIEIFGWKMAPKDGYRIDEKNKIIIVDDPPTELYPDQLIDGLGLEGNITASINSNSYYVQDGDIVSLTDTNNKVYKYTVCICGDVGRHGGDDIPGEYDDSSMTVTDIPAGTTADEFVGCTVTKDGAVLEADAIVTTGTVIALGSKKYTAVIKGDVSCDGNVNSTDFMQIKRAYLGLYELDDMQARAADTDADGDVNSTDFMQIRRHFLGLFDLYA